jgi:hypothetical protein
MSFTLIPSPCFTSGYHTHVPSMSFTLLPSLGFTSGYHTHVPSMSFTLIPSLGFTSGYHLHVSSMSFTLFLSLGFTHIHVPSMSFTLFLSLGFTSGYHTVYMLHQWVSLLFHHWVSLMIPGQELTRFPHRVFLSSSFTVLRSFSLQFPHSTLKQFVTGVQACYLPCFIELPHFVSPPVTSLRFTVVTYNVSLCFCVLVYSCCIAVFPTTVSCSSSITVFFTRLTLVCYARVTLFCSLRFPRVLLLKLQAYYLIILPTQHCMLYKYLISLASLKAPPLHSTMSCFIKCSFSVYYIKNVVMLNKRRLPEVQNCKEWA